MAKFFHQLLAKFFNAMILAHCFAQRRHAPSNLPAVLLRTHVFIGCGLAFQPLAQFVGFAPSRDGAFVQVQVTHFDECPQNTVHAVLPFAVQQIAVAVALAITFQVATDVTFEVERWRYAPSGGPKPLKQVGKIIQAVRPQQGAKACRLAVISKTHGLIPIPSRLVQALHVFHAFA